MQWPDFSRHGFNAFYDRERQRLVLALAAAEPPEALAELGFEPDGDYAFRALSRASSRELGDTLLNRFPAPRVEMADSAWRAEPWRELAPLEQYLAEIEPDYLEALPACIKRIRDSDIEDLMRGKDVSEAVREQFAAGEINDQTAPIWMELAHGIDRMDEHSVRVNRDVPPGYEKPLWEPLIRATKARLVDSILLASAPAAPIVHVADTGAVDLSEDPEHPWRFSWMDNAPFEAAAAKGEGPRWIFPTPEQALRVAESRESILQGEGRAWSTMCVDAETGAYLAVHRSDLEGMRLETLAYHWRSLFQAVLNISGEDLINRPIDVIRERRESEQGVQDGLRMGPEAWMMRANASYDRLGEYDQREGESPREWLERLRPVKTADWALARIAKGPFAVEFRGASRERARRATEQASSRLVWEAIERVNEELEHDALDLAALDSINKRLAEYGFEEAADAYPVWTQVLVTPQNFNGGEDPAAGGERSKVGRALIALRERVAARRAEKLASVSRERNSLELSDELAAERKGRARVEDFGEEIPQARKHRHRGHLPYGEVSDLSASELSEWARRDWIWKKPNVKSMQEAELDPLVAAFRLEVHKLLPAHIGSHITGRRRIQLLGQDTAEGARYYCKAIAAVRDLVEQVETRDELDGFYHKFHAAMRDLTIEHRESEATRLASPPQFLGRKMLTYFPLYDHVDPDSPPPRRYELFLVGLKSNYWQADQEMSWAQMEPRKRARAHHPDGEPGKPKTPPRAPHLEHIKREGGRDYRGGRDASGEAILENFGFRGGQFGNWLSGKERQEVLNLAYDSLADLADTIGADAAAVGLWKRLGVAFGARGHGGKAVAHYEPGIKVVNLTRLRGGGSLAHEWAHAFDHWLGEVTGLNGGVHKPFFSQWASRYSSRAFFSPVNENPTGTSEAAAAAMERDLKTSGCPEPYRNLARRVGRLMAVLRARDTGDTHLEPSKLLAEARRTKSKYWSEPHELFARGFATLLQQRMKNLGVRNDYLVAGSEPERYADRDLYKFNPNVPPAEAAELAPVFEDMLAAIAIHSQAAGQIEDEGEEESAAPLAASQR